MLLRIILIILVFPFQVLYSQNTIEVFCEIKTDKHQISTNDYINISVTLNNQTEVPYSFSSLYTTFEKLLEFYDENFNELPWKFQMITYKDIHTHRYHLFELKKGESKTFNFKIYLQNDNLELYNFSYNGYFLGYPNTYLLLNNSDKFFIKANYELFDDDIQYIEDELGVKNFFKLNLASNIVELKIEK